MPESKDQQPAPPPGFVQLTAHWGGTVFIALSAIIAFRDFGNTAPRGVVITAAGDIQTVERPEMIAAAITSAQRLQRPDREQRDG